MQVEKTFVKPAKAEGRWDEAAKAAAMAKAIEIVKISMGPAKLEEVMKALGFKSEADLDKYLTLASEGNVASSSLYKRGS